MICLQWEKRVLITENITEYSTLALCTNVSACNHEDLKLAFSTEAKPDGTLKKAIKFILQIPEPRQNLIVTNFFLFAPKW